MTLPRHWWLWPAIVAAALHLATREDAIETGPGVLAPDPPAQTRLVDADDGWRWIGSLRRDDTGQGACELIYVERASILESRDT